MSGKMEYNPDVLTCLANLSNDEVFTPPLIANELLDILPQEVFKDKECRFLDPATKSGVFLREIARRLMIGLEDQIPDEKERANHIFTNQLFGIALTELTALVSRRSLYCSKDANGEYSVCSGFGDAKGNVFFETVQHQWAKGKCIHCGASQTQYDRSNELETHAYQFIHTTDPGRFVKMKFDVIVGNPPYQLSTAGDANGAQAKPIYQHFIEQSIKLNPRYLTMIIPSRWFAGGWGLSEFRKSMINDPHIRCLHDFPNAQDVFPSEVSLKGGVCYFLRDLSFDGLTEFVTHEGNEITSSVKRSLKEPDCEIVIRHSKALPILRKVRAAGEQTFDNLVSTKKPFGFLTNYRGRGEPFKGAVKLYANRRIEYVDRHDISRRLEVVDSHKIIVPKAVGTGDGRTDRINPIYAEPNSCCTETYLLIGPFKSKSECENVMSYVGTKFFHFLVTLQKNTQDCMKKVYSFVPVQDFEKSWTDEELYKKYALTKEEIEYVEAMIRPMESVGG